MTATPCIRATFSDYRMVKGRKVLQLVMEVPLEQQANVFEALGYPMPDEERWYAIAPLNPAAVAGSRPAQVPVPQADGASPTPPGPGAKNLAKSWSAKEAYRNKTPEEKAVVLASLLVEDPAFQRWVGVPFSEADGDSTEIKEKFRKQAEQRADYMLKKWCFGSVDHSKSEFADNEAARIKLDELRVEFEMAMGRRAEVR